jgi:SAM-dependent methyltransferase
MTDRTSSGPSLGDIIRINDMFHDSALLHMAVASRLFDDLTTPQRADVVAAEHGWVPRKCRILLDALVAKELLDKQGDLYVNRADTTRFLTTGGESYVGAIIDHQRLQWDLWARMGEVLASNEATDVQQELRLRKDEAANTAFNQAMVQLSRDNLDDVLGVSELAEAGRVLDLCGGHGTYLAALALKHPELRGEVWDRETARELATQTFAQAGVADRLGFRAQDVLEPEAFAGASADACMLNDCLHYFDEAEVRTLIGQAAGLLSSGGVLVVLTMVLDNDRVSPLSAAGFSLHMMLNTNHGELHPTPWIEKVMGEAGLAVERRPAGSVGRYALLLGRRP